MDKFVDGVIKFTHVIIDHIRVSVPVENMFANPEVHLRVVVPCLLYRLLFGG